ncbi:hypothetical protein BJV78DRAFT_1235963 [Lactifluus subvellereus]|nr:hypothetical protein BJV78DRAFT_1235963 [Lactifluus subvellereus]
MTYNKSLGPWANHTSLEVHFPHCHLASLPLRTMLPRSKSPDGSPHHAGLPQQPQRRSASGLDNDNGPTTASPSARRPYPYHRRKTTPSQMALFRAAAPPIIFAILVAGLLVELRARLASPLPQAPPGIAVSMRGNTATQRVLIWAEARWPGLWALPLVCAAALSALRVVIWAGGTVLDRIEGQMVMVGRWEDGASVSGGELLAGMFT